MIHPDIIQASPVLREMQPPVCFEISDYHQGILLEYLSRPFYRLPEEVWTDMIVYLVDYLILPSEKLVNYYIVTGRHKELLERFRITVPTFTLVGINRKDYCKKAAQYGLLEILKWAHEQGFPMNNFEVYDVARYGGYQDVATWAIMRPQPPEGRSRGGGTGPDGEGSILRAIYG